MACGQICDPTKCCTTKVLSHTFGSEWVKNKLETWDGRKLGNCSDILFNSEAPGLTVTVNKGTKKKQALDITSIVVEASPTTDQKIIKKYANNTTLKLCLTLFPSKTLNHHSNNLFILKV